MRRGLAALIIGVILVPTSATAQTARHTALIVIVHGASMPELLEVPTARSLAASGGVALMNGRADARRTLKSVEDLRDDPAQLAIADVRGVDGLTTLLDEVYLTLRPPILLMIVAVSPSRRICR